MVFPISSEQKMFTTNYFMVFISEENKTPIRRNLHERLNIACILNATTSWKWKMAYSSA